MTMTTPMTAREENWEHDVETACEEMWLLSQADLLRKINHRSKFDDSKFTMSFHPRLFTRSSFRLTSGIICIIIFIIVNVIFLIFFLLFWRIAFDTRPLPSSFLWNTKKPRSVGGICQRLCCSSKMYAFECLNQTNTEQNWFLFEQSYTQTAHFSSKRRRGGRRFSLLEDGIGWC